MSPLWSRWEMPYRPTWHHLSAVMTTSCCNQLPEVLTDHSDAALLRRSNGQGSAPGGSLDCSDPALPGKAMDTSPANEEPQYCKQKDGPFPNNVAFAKQRYGLKHNQLYVNDNTSIYSVCAWSSPVMKKCCSQFSRLTVNPSIAKITFNGEKPLALRFSLRFLT